MDLKKKLLIFAFRKKKLNLIKLLIKKKFNITIDVKNIYTFLVFYNNDFNALLNVKINEKINNYKLFLPKLLAAKSDLFIDFIFINILLYLLFIAKLLQFNKKINSYICNNYCKKQEYYLNNINETIKGLKLNNINYKNFIKYKYRVNCNNLHLMILK